MGKLSLDKVTLIIGVLAIFVAVGIYLIQEKNNFDRIVDTLLQEKIYNISALNGFIVDMENGTFASNAYAHPLLTDASRQNLNIVNKILKKDGECSNSMNNYFNLIARLDAINSINNAIRNMLNIKSFADNNVFQDIHKADIEALSSNVTNSLKYFNELKKCGFPPENNKFF